jgi:hypothetical protein
VLFDPALPLSDQLLGLFLPVPVSRSPGLYGLGAAVEQAGDPVGELLAVSVRGDVVRGVGSVVVVGDDAADELGGVAAGAAAHDMQTVGLGMFVLAFAGEPLVQVGGVVFAAAGHRDIQQRAGGVLAEHGVGGVGGGALGGVHGDRVAVGDVGVSLAAERIRSLTKRGSRATSGAQHLDDPVDQALCLTLVTNAAVLWTTTYLSDALDAPRRT